MDVITQEIIRALRCSASPTVPPDEVCTACRYGDIDEWDGIPMVSCACDRIVRDAAKRLEELSRG